MHRVEEISLLRDQVEAVEADRDRWRRYAGMLRDRLAATQDAVRKWHHHAHCRDSYNGRVGEELRDLAGERDALNRQLDHADGRIIYLTSCVDALRQQLDESDHHLALRIEADNANRERLAEANERIAGLEGAYDHADGEIIDLTNANDALRQQLAEANAARERAERRLAFLEQPWPENESRCDHERRYFLVRDGQEGDAYDDCQICRAKQAEYLLGDALQRTESIVWRDRALRAEAEAGVMRRALEFYARAETYHVIGPNDGRRPIWEDTGEMARAALASGAGEKAGAVLAAAVSCAQAEERLEAAARARGPDIGPESHRAYVERLNLRNAVKLLLGDAVAAMEGKGDE